MSEIHISQLIIPREGGADCLCLKDLLPRLPRVFFWQFFISMFQEQYPNNVRNTEINEFQTNTDFNTFYSDKLLTIPPNGNIFIDDVPDLPLLDTGYQQLASMNNRELIVFKAEDLTRELAAHLDQIPKASAFIFPGNGSRIIQDILKQTYPEILQDRLSLAVKTKRTRKDGVWSVSVEVPELNDKLRQCTDWVIVDDVVLSGQTAQALQQEIKTKTRRESDSWTLATWLSLDPKRRKKITKTKNPSSVEGFDAVSAVYTYKGGNGIPPCNSLSTLLVADEKGQVVRNKLQSAYFPEGFDQFLQQLTYGKT